MANEIVTRRDVLGKEVFSQSYSATQKVEIDVQTTLGIYFVELKENVGQQVVPKLIRE